MTNTAKIGFSIIAAMGIVVALKLSFNKGVSKNEGNLMVAQIDKPTKGGSKLTINYVADANTIIFGFPQNEPPPVGKITFFHPKQTHKNRAFDLKIDPAKQMFIRIDGFDEGVWRIVVEWQGEDKIYTHEEKIDLQPNDWERPVH